MQKRIIKFRLILEDKIVGYEEHDLAYHNGKKQIIVMHSSDNEEWWNTIHDSTKWIQHDDKEEFIGLKDKNNKEIYKGDIVKNIKDIFPDLKGETIFKVIYQGCSFVSEYKTGTFFMSTGKYYEIIGNIYKEKK